MLFNVAVLFSDTSFYFYTRWSLLIQIIYIALSAYPILVSESPIALITIIVTYSVAIIIAIIISIDYDIIRENEVLYGVAATHAANAAMHWTFAIILPFHIHAFNRHHLRRNIRPHHLLHAFLIVAVMSCIYSSLFDPHARYQTRIPPFTLAAVSVAVAMLVAAVATWCISYLPLVHDTNDPLAHLLRATRPSSPAASNKK